MCSKTIKDNSIELFLAGGNTLYVKEEMVIPKAVEGLNFSSSYKITNSNGGVVGLVRKPLQIYNKTKYTQTEFILTTGIISTKITKFEIHDRFFGEIIFTVDIDFIDDAVMTKEKITCKFKTEK